jgi:hypothetical protein
MRTCLGAIRWRRNITKGCTQMLQNDSRSARHDMGSAGAQGGMSRKPSARRHTMPERASTPYPKELGTSQKEFISDAFPVSSRVGSLSNTRNPVRWATIQQASHSLEPHDRSASPGSTPRPGASLVPLVDIQVTVAPCEQDTMPISSQAIWVRKGHRGEVTGYSHTSWQWVSTARSDTCR